MSRSQNSAFSKQISSFKNRQAKKEESSSKPSKITRRSSRGGTPSDRNPDLILPEGRTVETPAQGAERLRREELQSLQRELSRSGSRLSSREAERIASGKVSSSQINTIREREKRRADLKSLQSNLSSSGTRLTSSERTAIGEGRGVDTAISSANARVSRSPTAPLPSSSPSLISSRGEVIPVSQGVFDRTRAIERKQGVAAFLPVDSGGFSQAPIPNASSERVGAFTYTVDEARVASMRNDRLYREALPAGLFGLRSESGERLYEPGRRPKTFLTVNSAAVDSVRPSPGRVAVGSFPTSDGVNTRFFSRIPARPTPKSDFIEGDGSSRVRSELAGVTRFVEERPKRILVQDFVALRLGGFVTKRGLIVASATRPIAATRAISFGTKFVVSSGVVGSLGAGVPVVAEPGAIGRSVVPTVAFFSGFKSAPGSLIPRVTGVSRSPSVTTITSASGRTSASFTRGATNVNFLDDSFSVPFTETSLARSSPTRLTSLTRRTSNDPFLSQQQRNMLSRRTIGDVDVLSSGDSALLVRTSQSVTPEFGDSFSVVESGVVNRRSPLGSVSSPQVTSEFSRVNPSGTTTTRSFLRQGESPSFDFGRFAGDADLFPSRAPNRRGSLTVGGSSPADDLFGSRFLPDDIAAPSARGVSPSRSLVPSVSLRSAFPRGGVRNNFFFGVPVNVGGRVSSPAVGGGVLGEFGNQSLSPLRVGVGTAPSSLVRSVPSDGSLFDSGSVGSSFFDVGSLGGSSSFTGSRPVSSSSLPSPFRSSRPVGGRGFFPFVPPVVPFIAGGRGGGGKDSEDAFFGKSRSSFLPSVTAIAFNLRESSSKRTSGFTGFELRGLR